MLAVHWRDDRTCHGVEIENKTTWTRRVAVRVTQGNHLELVSQGDDKKFGALRDMCLVPRAGGEILLARDCTLSSSATRDLP